MKLEQVVVVAGLRTAFGRGGKGKLVATRLAEAGAKLSRALRDRNPKNSVRSCAKHAYPKIGLPLCSSTIGTSVELRHVNPFTDVVI